MTRTRVQRRERTWALDRGREFACAVAVDEVLGQYYACVQRDSASGKVDLCAWTEEDGAKAATIGEASKRCTKEIVLIDDARVKELFAVQRGALVVTTTGELQLFNTSAEFVCGANEKTRARRVEFAAALPDSVGALVLTTDVHLKKRRATAYVVTGASDSQRVEQAWELDINHPDGADKLRVVTAASDGETIMILWEDGLWVLHDTSDGTVTHKLKLDGLDCQGEAISGKRSKKKSENSSRLTTVASLCLSQDYYAIAANDKEENTVIVAVIDSRYGAVHLAEDVSQGLEQKVGRTSGVSLAATSGALIVGLSDQVLSVQLDLPELSLAALVGSLTVSAQPEVSNAASRILGVEAVSSAIEVRQHAAVTPTWKLDDVKVSGQGLIDLGHEWNNFDSQAAETSVRSAAEALASGSKRASSSLEAMMKILPIPQILLDSAIKGALTHRSWEPVSILLRGGHICGSSTAQLVPALLEEDKFDELNSFLLHATDVSTEDLTAILRAGLSRDAEDPHLKKCAMANKKMAERVLEEAEECILNDKSGETKQEVIARAKLLVCAYDSFAPWAQQLHALIARPLDPATSLSVLRKLSKKEAVSLLDYLLVWTKFYSSSEGLFARINTLAETGIPSAHAVVNWTSALLDAQLAMFCLADDVTECVRELKESSTHMLDMMRSLATLKGALRHVSENSPLPEQHGVVSTTYTVESVAW